MKLRNKETGEIGWLYCDYISVPKKMTVFAEDKDLSANHWDYKNETVNSACDKIVERIKTIVGNFH